MMFYIQVVFICVSNLRNNYFVVSDNSLVVSAPTGSGKTAIFELAIINLLMKMKNMNEKYFKIIYGM